MVDGISVIERYSMLVSVVNLKCSNCGEPLSESITRCPSCDQPVVIKKISSLLGLTQSELYARSRLMDSEGVKNQGTLYADTNYTAGCCLLRLKMYDQAILRFGKVIEISPCNADVFFSMAIADLKGLRPFLAPLVNVRKALENLARATMIEDRAVFHYFLAYIKFDFYARRFLRIDPNWQYEFRNALTLGLTTEEANELFDVLEKECPEELEILDSPCVVSR